MLNDYLAAAMETAHFEIIEDDEPYYGSIPPMKGVWATGKTLEACRRQLASALEDWVFFSIAQGLPLPVVKGRRLTLPKRVPVVV